MVSERDRTEVDVPFEGALATEWKSILQDLRDALRSWFLKADLWTAGVLIIAIVFVLLVESRAFGTIEGGSWDRAFGLTVSVACGLVFAAWSRAIYLWSRLSSFLELLDLHPIGQAFDKIPPECRYSILDLGGWKRRHVPGNHSVDYQPVALAVGAGADTTSGSAPAAVGGSRTQAVGPQTPPEGAIALRTVDYLGFNILQIRRLLTLSRSVLSASRYLSIPIPFNRRRPFDGSSRAFS